MLRRTEEGDQADIFNIIQKRPNTGVNEVLSPKLLLNLNNFCRDLDPCWSE